jgi:hypothetical protein
MGSVKLKDLKAFVRYDGSGRVVSGSLVFRKKKPKNGRWVEITKNECCSETPSSTTTTTTQGGGGGTPTAFIQLYWFNANNACTSTTDGQFVVYSASSTLSAGSTVFTDAALTIPVQFGYVIVGLQMGSTKYLVGAGGVLSVLNCETITTTTTTTSITSTTTTTTVAGINIYASFSRPEACGQVGGSFMTIYSNSPLGIGVEIFTDPAKTIPYDTNIYGVCIVPIGSNTWYYTSEGYVSTEGNLCTTGEFYSFTGETPVEACSQQNFNVFFYSNLSPLGVGTAIYKDEPLTIPYNPATDGGIYISSEFGGALQLCTMSGNIIQSYTPC